MHIETNITLKKRAEAETLKKAHEEAEAERRKERKAEKLRKMREKFQEEEKARQLALREEIQKHDQKRELKTGETKDERRKREFGDILKELKGNQQSEQISAKIHVKKKQEINDDSAQQEAQALEEPSFEIVVQQLEEIHIEDDDLQQSEDINQENQPAD